MGELVCAGIAPHGYSVIGEIAGSDFEPFKPTRDAMEQLGRMILDSRPDTIVILTPHGLRLKGYNAIYTSEYCRGSLSGNGTTVSLEYKCDKEMAEEILIQAVKENIPSVGCNFGALEGEASNIEMDWGTLIPLWFCRETNYNPRLVVICPNRDIPMEKLVGLGEIIGRIAVKSDRKVALIASADQAHCHDQNGPYGFDTAAKEYDEQIVAVIKSNELSRLLDINMELVGRAKPDSLWQMLILYGALKVTPMVGEILSYQVPTYFGMSVVCYTAK